MIMMRGKVILQGIVFDLQRVLHGEQYIEFYRPLNADGGQVRSETRVVDILDKGSGALILANGLI
jgi:3-hydroxyacyl-CoA dehydrogenase/3a,7a,12a-trihydroxy-5b-cholest-24-enoyl-CoA hydratase